jgi:hypothetical protein
VLTEQTESLIGPLRVHDRPVGVYQARALIGHGGDAKIGLLSAWVGDRVGLDVVVPKLELRECMYRILGPDPVEDEGSDRASRSVHRNIVDPSLEERMGIQPVRS